MSIFNFHVVETGSSFPKVKISNTLAVDFLSIALGADSLPIVQAGSGGSAYFDFGAKKLSSSFAAVGANDLTNKAAVDALISAQAAIRIAAEAALQSNIDLKLSLSGGTMTGAIAMGGFKITGAGNPTNPQDLATKFYVDAATAAVDLSAYFKKDGSVAATGDFNMNGHKLSSLLDPTSGQDAATKAYVDAVALGLAPKKAVRVSSTANVAISSALINGAVMDGITLVTGNRVLLKDQTASAENGIYVVVASGAASRATDMDSLTPIDEVNGAWVPVQLGTVNAGRIFVQYGNVATIGTDAITFEFYNPLAALVGGDMITNSGSTFSVDLATNSGLESNNPGNVGGQLQIKINGTTLTKDGSGIKVGALAITSAEIAATAVDENKISASVAGNGLSGGAGTPLAVNVTSNLQISSDNVDIQYAQLKVNDNASPIVANKIVYIKSNGHVDLASKTLAINDTELGVVQDASIAAAASGLIIFKRGAHISGFSGLIPGTEYFIDAAGLMAVYSAITFAANDNVYSLGKALDANILIYNPSYKFQF